MSSKKRKAGYLLFIISLMVFLSGSIAGYANADVYEVDSIFVSAVVDRSHQIQVTEEVNMIFDTAGNSIKRTIPLLVDNQRFEIDQIQGVGVEIDSVWKRNEVVLTMKKPSGSFSGVENFQLKYVLRGGQDQEPDSDFFYLSIIAPDWNTYINHARFQIEFPTRILPEMVAVQSARKQVASRETMLISVEGNQVAGKSQYFLVPGESISIGVQLPEGTFSEAMPLSTFYEETASWEFGLTIGALLMAIGWWFWWKEKLKEPISRTTPPPEASPAEIHYLFSRTVVSRDLSVLLLQWANRGWIHFYTNFSGLGGKDGAALTLVRRLPTESSAYELRLFSLLFDEYGNGHRVRLEDLRGRFFLHFEELTHHLKAEYSVGPKAFFKNHQTKNEVGLTVFASLPISFFWLRVVFESYRGWFGAVLSLILIAIQLLAIRWSESGDRSSKRIVGLLSLALLAVYAIVLQHFFGFLLALGSAGMIMYLIKWSEEKTIFGIERIRQYQGYREFLSNVEKEKVLTMIQDTPELYYEGLPFAERLGVLNEWKKRFKEIFFLPPIWYHGEESNQFSIEESTRELMAFLAHFEEVIESKDGSQVE